MEAVPLERRAALRERVDCDQREQHSTAQREQRRATGLRE